MSSAITLPRHQVVTHNDATATENKIHSDEIAKKYGFRGGLVPGVTVFGHMTYPLVAEFGERWLAKAVGEVRLHKPAYEGEQLTVDSQSDGAGYLITARNDAGEVLARLTTHIPDRSPAPDPRWRTTPSAGNPPREEIAAGNIVVDRPLAALRLQPEVADNLSIAAHLSDDLPIYSKPAADIVARPVHPLWFARACNRAFTARWIMPAWIHVGTEFVLHRPLRVTQNVEIRAIPTRVWTHKGHEFATLYLAFLIDGDLAAEARHTAIYKVAERAADHG